MKAENRREERRQTGAERKKARAAFYSWEVRHGTYGSSMYVFLRVCVCGSAFHFSSSPLYGLL